MTFFVRKSLATGPIRFGVSPRIPLASIDREEGLSTGGAGEFIRKRGSGFFFADERPFADPSLPLAPSITRIPFLASLKDGTPRGYGFMAMIGAGALLILLGMAVVARKGPQGFVEIVLGAILIATPIIITAQKRKQLREQEEKERAAREALEARNRQMLSSYSTALERLRREKSDEAVEALRQEGETLDLPYEIWSAAARSTVLRIGFDVLAQQGSAGSAQVNELVARAARAAGLTDADQSEVQRDIYRSVLWHLLADDRLGEIQTAELARIRQGFGMAEDLPAESRIIAEFHRLRGITPASLPRQDCGIPMGFKEYCIHHSRGVLMALKKRSWVEAGACDVYITNRRILVSAKDGSDISLPKIDDVDVDIDAALLTIKTADPRKPITLRVEDPIYTACLIDFATRIDDRPKGFA